MRSGSWVRLVVFSGAALTGGLFVQSHVSAGGQLSPLYEAAASPNRVLVADPTNSFTRVAAPRELVARPMTATVSVTYSGFSAAAQTAFQSAVDIWQTQLTSTVPIQVVANFTSLGSGVLGSAGSNFVYRNFANGVPNTFYAAALANKLAGSDLNPSQHDINANFNSNFSNWYFGTDGNTPSGQYDFKSVVLHELCHGLGFFGSMNLSGNSGSYGLGTPANPMIFDTFAVNGSGQSLVNTALFPNPSSELATQLTGDNLFWNGAQGISGGGGTRPKLYVPATWASGSSFSHLDDATYPAGNANSLMTHAIGSAEAIHDPGPITRGIFSDMGWTATAPSCSYSISPTTASVGSGAGTGGVTVITNGTCAWTATSNASFLTVTGGASSAGSGTVTYSVATNTGAARTGTITIAGQTFTVTQSALSCSYAISPTAASVAASAGIGSVTVTTSSGCTWTATSNATFVTVTGGASGSGSGIVSYSYSANAGAARTGTLTLAGQTFTVSQSAPTCSYTISPASVSVGVGAGTGSVSVTTTSGCAWTAASNASFLTITSGASGSASGAVAYSVAANSAGTSRSGTLTIAGQTVTVTQSGTAATLTLNRTTTRFAAVNVGGTLTAQTSAQMFTLNQSGLGTLAWTAAASQPWLTVSPASGTGTSSFTVSINSASLPASGTTTGSVTLTAPAAGNSPQVLAVAVVVYPSVGNTSAPFGSWDTPAANATGIAGALALTGWSLDDIEVSRIRIYRASLGSEAAGQIFIGDALFVSGARPDIETANPTRPFNYRAGWGYQLLTNVLPGGGNGMYTFYVYADDREGRTTLLGTRNVTIANSTATKPFGAIDAPAPGATISGTAFVNYGWALTPNPPKVIPLDGSTITLLIDGVSQGQVTYNQPRADIAGLFPGYANSNGSLGTRTINTTAFSNGVHTISWNVFDSAGIGEGIGSRYFTIQNGSSVMTGSMAAPSNLGSLRALQATHTPDGARLSHAPIRVVRGYQDDAPAEIVATDTRGVRAVLAREQDRLVMRLSDDRPASHGTFAGYLVVGDELRPLPIGSTLDEQEGVFSWGPGPGFLGSYDLVFVRTERDGRREQIPVRVILRSRY